MKLQNIICTVLLLCATSVYAADTKTVSLKVEGMTCESCVKKLKKQLSGLCSELQVFLKEEKAVCTYGGSVTTEQIIAEANKTGFQVSL
ncbi:MAG: heavy metal-associated domain-containing protein [Deltaproteobacteria bacterium]|nr:heavy metal-associated domain-containing protein [Deltaproteobacteria bacterium]